MPFDFNERFTPREGDKVYKGVHIRQDGRQSGKNKHNAAYSFEVWWNAPVGRSYRQSPDDATTRKWISFTEGPTGLSHVKDAVNDYLSRGYTVHPNGHMRAPGYSE